MKKGFITKRLLAFLLASAMVITSVPEVALAAGIDEDIPDEEVVLEEGAGDVIEPDASTDDLYYGVVAATAAKFGVFTVQADVATAHAKVEASAIASKKPGNSNRTAFNSDNGFQIYVVPKIGYEFKDLATAKSAITVEGAWQANTADTTGTPIGESDYSIAKTTKPYVTDGGTTYDFAEAYVVTINGGSQFLTDYKAAYYATNDCTATASKAGIKTDLNVTIVEASKITPKKINVSVTGATAAFADIDVNYESNYATEILLGSAADWTTKDVKVALVNSDSEVVDIDYTADTVVNATTGTKYQWNAGTKKLIMTSDAYTTAYEKQADGYTLTIKIADKEAAPATKVGLVTSSTLVKFSTINADANGTLEKDTANYATTVSGTALERSTQKGIPFKAEIIGASSARSIKTVKYAVGDADAAVASEVDVDQGEYGAAGTSYLLSNGSNGSNFATADSDYYAVPAAELPAGAAGKNVELIAETKEGIGIALPKSGSNSLVSFEDDTDLKGTSKIAVDDNISGMTPANFDSSTVETGKDYTFSIIPKSGYKIGTVSVSRYSTDGTRAIPITADELKSYKGEYDGTYTIPNVTSKLSIGVTVETLDGAPVVVKYSTTYATAEGVSLRSGDAITNGNKTLSYVGDNFKFKIKPENDKLITGIKYDMGALTDQDATCDKVDMDGTVYYTIPDVTGDVILTLTEVDAVRITKVANPDVTITMGGSELKDGKTALVKAATATGAADVDFTVTAASGVTVQGVYYKFITTGTAVTSLASYSASDKKGETAKTYTIDKSFLAKTTGSDIKITVVTSKAAPAGYTKRFDTNRTDVSTESGHEENVTALALKAGGSVATSDASDLYSAVEVTAILEDAEGAVINTNTTTSNTWNLGKTTTETAIASSTPKTDTRITTIVSTKLSSTDTLTYTYKTGFPNETVYTAELPVTTSEMNGIYQTFELVPTVTAGGSDCGLFSDATALGTALSEAKTIRVDDAGTIDDSVTYTIKAYKNADDTIGAIIGGAISVGGTYNIQSVKWTVTPGYSDTLKDSLKPYLVSGGATPAATIDTAKEAQTLNVTAEVTFADGSKKSVEDTLNVIEATYGYVAVPVTQIGSQSEVYGNKTMMLEAPTSSSLHSGNVSWRVFKQKVATSVLAGTELDSETNLEAAITAKKFEEVTATFATPTITGNTDSEFANIPGTSNVTVVAKKKTSVPITVTPNAKVGNMPVAADVTGIVTIGVFNELPQLNASVQTYDSIEEGLGSEYNLSKAYPKLTSGDLLSKGQVSWTAKTIGANPEVFTGFNLENIPLGTEITLPSEAAFDATTINAKKSLYGWEVVEDTANNGFSSGTTTTYYKPNGAEKVTVKHALRITALWAYDYSSDGSTNDGYVRLYKEIGTATPTAIDGGAGTSTLSVASGKGIQLKVGYCKLDVEAGPNAGGNPQWELEAGIPKMTYTSDGLTFSNSESATFKNIIEAPVNGLITGKAEGSVSADVKWETTNNNNQTVEFSTYQTSSGLKAATDGLKGQALTVTTLAPTTYVVEFDPITDLAVGETRTGVTMSVKRGATSVTSGDFASVEFTSANGYVKVTEAAALTSFTIEGLKAGDDTITFTAIDPSGNIATLANVAVKVSTGIIEIGLAVDEGNANISRDGAIAATATEVPVLMQTNNIFTITLKKNGQETDPSDTALTYAIADKGTETPALTAAGAANTTSHKFTIKPTALGISTVEVAYVDGTSTFTREFDIRSYYAIAMHGSATATKDDYQILKGATAIATDAVEYEFIDYAENDTEAPYAPAKYTKSLASYSAKPLADHVKSEEFIGWQAVDLLVSADAVAKKAALTGNKFSVAKGGSITELAASDLVDLDFATVNGVIDFFARFANIAPTYTFTGIESGDIIELDDSKLTTAATPAGVGSDHRTITIGVTPYADDTQLYIESDDTGKFRVADAEYDTPTPPGFAAAGAWDGDFTPITVDTAKTTNKSRVDKFAIGKIINTDNAASKNYVGSTTLRIRNGGTVAADILKTVTVYFNGEFKDTTDVTTPTRYMYRGSVLESGVKTVNGELHIYNDSALVKAGVADVVEDGVVHKALVVGSIWYQTAGIKSYDDNTYYVDKDGFLLTSQLYKDGNNQYYLNDNGVRVTYAMALEDRGEEQIGDKTVKYGKYIDETTKIKYVIYEDGTAKEDDKRIVDKVSDFTWTPANTKAYKKGATVTATITVKYHLQTAGTEDTLTFDTTNGVVVTKNNDKSTGKKLVYDASFSTTGFFDSKGEAYDFSKCIGTITYNIDPATGDGKIGGIEIVGIDTSDTGYDYTGVAVKPAFTVVDNDRDVVLAAGVDYSLTWKDNKKPGLATVTVNGKGNYEGKTITAQFKIVDRVAEAISGGVTLAAGVKKITLDKKANECTYDGTEKFPKSFTVTTSTGAIIKYEGDGTTMPTPTEAPSEEVVISISNNINKGSATVTATGSDNKIKKATFKINAASLASTTDVTWTPDDAVWAVKGATTNINAQYGTNDLVLGQDYTVKWSYATKGKDAGEKAGKFVLKGKGNYTGTSAEGTFDITAYALDKEKISVAAYTGANAAKLKVTVTDDQGVLIPASALLVTSNASGKLTADQDVEVTVKGKTSTNISGEETIAITAKENLGAAKVKFSDKRYSVEYTGEPIDLDNMENAANPFDSGMITVTSKSGKTLVYNTDFEITGYQNNIKKGTMKVTINGIGDNVSGTKIVSIKIKAKTMKKAD